jgi:ribosome recycling factor
MNNNQFQPPIDNLRSLIASIRLGTISPGVVDSVKATVNGQLAPIGHLATTFPTKQGITVTPHDPASMNEILAALRFANLSAYAFSKTSIIVSVPPVTGEAKSQVHRHVKKLGDDARLAVRNIRQCVRKSQGKPTKEDQARFDKDIQVEVDAANAEIDRIVARKVAEI